MLDLLQAAVVEAVMIVPLVVNIFVGSPPVDLVHQMVAYDVLFGHDCLLSRYGRLVVVSNVRLIEVCVVRGVQLVCTFLACRDIARQVVVASITMSILISINTLATCLIVQHGCLITEYWHLLSRRIILIMSRKSWCGPSGYLLCQNFILFVSIRNTPWKLPFF